MDSYQKTLHSTVTGVIVCLMITLLVVLFCLWETDCHADMLVPISPSSPASVTTIQPPVGLPSYAYTSPSGVTTIQPPVGLPTYVYPGSSPSQPTTIQPPVGLPSYIYGR